MAKTDGDPTDWDSLCTQFTEAHGDLRRAMSQLDTMGREPVPAREHFATVRWNLSRASLRRRGLAGEIRALLTCKANLSEAATLRRLQDTDIAMCHASSEHVAQWSTDAALSHWSEYCTASREIRSKMAGAMDSERRILYPLLLGRRQPPAESAAEGAQ